MKRVPHLTPDQLALSIMGQLAGLPTSPGGRGKRVCNISTPSIGGPRCNESPASATASAA